MEPNHFMVYSKQMENNSILIEKIKSTLISHQFVYDEQHPTLIIILGGDGSFLRAVHDPRLPRGRGIQYVLFNTGHLGFYADYQRDEGDAFIKDLIENTPTVESLPFYRLTIDGKEHHCINDIAIQSGETVFLNAYVNHELLAQSRCNGIVIGTPTGSSGFLASLGAPLIIHGPDVYQFSILAPCRNRMFVNPITKAVISGKDELEVEIDRNNTMEIYIDGGHKTKFRGKKFTFSHRRNDYVSLLHFRKLSYVARLRKNISGKD
jgi:NAD+ kinase